MYEISNEPRQADTAQYPHQSEDWLFEVASWADGLLWDANFNRRKRLLMLNLGSGAFRTSVLKRLLTGAGHHLIDLFSFHGTEWSHPPNVADPTIAQIQAQTCATVSAFYNTDLGTTPAKKVGDYPVTILLDTDANYPAQDGPTKYLKAALGLKASFNYRWSDDFIGELTDKLEDINHGNAPTGFSVTPVSDSHNLTFHWNPVPRAAGYRIKFYPPAPEYPAYLGYGTVGAPAAGSEIHIAGGATTQYAANYPGTFCVSATIRAYFATGDETAESTMIRVAAGPTWDCEVVDFNLPSGDLSSHTYAGWIKLKNTGWFPWTRYKLPELPNNDYTFDVSLGVSNTPTGYPFAYSQRFVIQPQSTTFFVKTGEMYTFQITYTLPNSTGTLYVHHYFDQFTIVPGYASSRIKDLGIVRGVRVIAQAAP
ncbi:MAG TPA: hypothetical protein VKA60_24395 [Blastocatellia bacterium]|nr:hypothetical protein [Blastocatellia bacterium]